MTKTALWMVGALFLSGCLVPKDQYETLRREADLRAERIQAAEKNAAALEQRLATVDAELAAEKQQRAATEQKLAETERQLSDQSAEKNALMAQHAQLQALNDELSKNTRKLEQAKAELEKKSSEYEGLAESLKGEIQAGKVELSELKGRMTVKMKDKILFSSGSAKLGREGQAALDKVAAALKDVQGKIIRVEGHTDSDPVDRSGPFPSNWELSLARAMAVVAHLETQGVDPSRLSAAGYGQHQPIAPNRTPEQKSANRRIEIVLAPALPGSPAAKVNKTAGN